MKDNKSRADEMGAAKGGTVKCGTAGTVKWGTVGRPNGLKGAFFLNDCPWKSLPQFLSGKKPSLKIGSKSYSCSSIRVNSNKKIIIQLPDLKSREMLEPHSGDPVYIDLGKVQCRDLEGGFFPGFLWGRSVCNGNQAGAEMDMGRSPAIGKIISIDNYGASDLASIELSQPVNAASVKTAMVPVVEEFFDLSEEALRSEGPIALRGTWEAFFE